MKDIVRSLKSALETVARRHAARMLRNKHVCHGGVSRCDEDVQDTLDSSIRVCTEGLERRPRDLPLVVLVLKAARLGVTDCAWGLA